MSHPPLVWELTVALIGAMLLFNYFFNLRTAHVLRGLSHRKGRACSQEVTR
jgi:hypothetical protein